MAVEVPHSSPSTAEQQSAVVLGHLSTYLPEITPYLKEFYGFDPKTFKHSMLVASIASTAFYGFNQITKIVPEQNVGRVMESLEIGCALHDIGKMGIAENLELAYQALYPEKFGKTNGAILVNANQDLRTEEAKKIVHTHPLIGGYIVLELLNRLQFRRDKALTKEMYRMIASIAFDHHEKASDTLHIRGSYPRSNGYRPQTPLGKLTHLFAECADIYEGMRSRRDYNEERNAIGGVFHPLAIGEKLREYLSPKLLYETFGLITAQEQETIRVRIINSISGAAGPMDNAITQKVYILQGKNVNGEEWRGTPIEKSNLIPGLVKEILTDLSSPNSRGWRIHEYLDEEVTTGFHDLTRYH